MTIRTLAVLLSALLFHVNANAESNPLRIDGKLDEQEWKNAKEETGFKPFSENLTGQEQSIVATRFRWFTDEEALYVGIECDEPAMDKVKARPGPDFSMSVFESDTVEIFVDPQGKGNEFYQFSVNAAGRKFNLYSIEGGNTTGGEYGGIWDAAVDRQKDKWTVEMRIPFTAFYRTDSKSFSTEWKFNVARHRQAERWGEFSSWSPLKKRFHEPENFRKLSGMPSKDSDLDIYVDGATLEVLGKGKDGYEANAVVNIQNSGPARENAKVELQIDHRPIASAVAPIARGASSVELKGLSLPSVGKQTAEIVISSAEGKILHRRFVTNRAKYEPITITFDEPFYANCIFPGQNPTAAKGTVVVTLPKDELANATVEVRDGGSDWSKSFAIQDGKAEIEIPAEIIKPGKNLFQVSVNQKDQVLAKTETQIRRLSWPESGSVVYLDRNLNLVINGQTVFALGFMGGVYPQYTQSRALQKKYGWKPYSRFMNALDGWTYVQPDRVLPSDSGMFTSDVEPSEEMYAAVLKRIKEARPKSSTLFYYLNDEPECRGVSPVYLGYLYRFIKEHDPYHPVLIVTRSPELYTECADILSPHPYTDPNILRDGTRTMKSVRPIVDKVQAVLSAGKNRIAPWCTPQAFSYAFVNNSSVCPTFDETRCMVYAAVVAGAKGLIPFAYANTLADKELRLGYDFIYESLFMLSPYLLQPIPGLPVKVESEEEAVIALLHEKDGKYALFTVNLLPQKAQATLQLPPALVSSKWFGFRTDENATTTDGALHLDYLPYEVKVFTTDDRIDKSLKSLADLRYELNEDANSSGNSLRGKGNEIVWDASSIWPSVKMLRRLGSLCDGVTDALGYRGR